MLDILLVVAVLVMLLMFFICIDIRILSFFRAFES